MESVERSSQFVKPDILAERGEFTRVADTFSLDEGVLMHVAETEGKLAPLSGDVWDVLENTDSNRFGTGDWSAVDEHASAVGRDWQQIREGLQRGIQYDAPIVMRYQGVYHLVSGNTRLMVARALGLTPKVWLFEVYDNEA